VSAPAFSTIPVVVRVFAVHACGARLRGARRSQAGGLLLMVVPEASSSAAMAFGVAAETALRHPPARTRRQPAIGPPGCRGACVPSQQVASPSLAGWRQPDRYEARVLLDPGGRAREFAERVSSTELCSQPRVWNFQRPNCDARSAFMLQSN
jgi:hypothetical protein